VTVDDARTVLLVVDSQDPAGLAESGLRTAALLAATSAAAPIVTGEQGTALELAATMGLEAIELAGTRRDRRRDLAHLVERADIVHALGLRAALSVAAVGLPAEQPVAVTVDSVAARIGGRSPFVALRNRAATRWLVPGRTATTSLVYRGLVPGDRVMTLPVLGYAANSTVAWSAWPAARAAARRRLGVPPGVHVVVGFGPGRARGLRCLETLSARGEPILACWIESQASGRQGGRLRIVSPSQGQQMFAAMDVLVADGCAIAAAHPAVDARRIGVPIVASAADVAAGLVVHSRNGYIATSTELDGAIAAALAMAVARTLHPQPEQHGPGERERQAGITAGCYSALLGHPLVRPVLMGRRASR
jgi:hypothetical protein